MTAAITDPDDEAARSGLRATEHDAGHLISVMVAMVSCDEALLRRAEELLSAGSELLQQCLETRITAARLKAEWRAEHIRWVRLVAEHDPRAALRLARIVLNRDARALASGKTGY